MVRRAHGFLLLPVTLTLVIVGALAYAMTRDAGAAIGNVEADYDTEAARYLAEAALNLTRWRNNQQQCGAVARFQPTPLYRYNLANGRVGTAPADLVGTMSLNDVVIVKNNSDNLKNGIAVDVSSATTTLPAAAHRIVRTVPRYDLGSKKDAVIRGNNGANTFIYAGPNATPQGSMAYMELTDDGPSRQSYGLLHFGMGPIPKNALVREATLKLKRFDGEWFPLLGRKVDIHRVTTAWDYRTATWSFPWSKAGGDYAAEPVASAMITISAPYYWRIEALVAGWVDGTMPNHGLLLKPTNLDKSRFSAFASGTSDGPELTVTYHERCD